jgi:EXS family
VIAWEILPALYLVLLLLLFALPVFRFSRNGRYRFLRTLKRVSIGGLAPKNQDGKFADIILADVLTSYSKVLGDLFVCICMFFTKGTSSTAMPNRACGGDFLVPIIVSIPSFIRLRQCLIEFIRVRKHRQASDGWGGQHLSNALKYFTAFPVIFLSALQRGHDPSKIPISETGLHRFWYVPFSISPAQLTVGRLLFVFLNSFYSFYWDVAKDWGLHLFSSASKRDHPDYPYGLRLHRHFHANTIYYTAIAINLLLRCTWSLKLSPHLGHLNDREGGIFMMEILEVMRRWLWIFLRFESEWSKSSPHRDMY